MACVYVCVCVCVCVCAFVCVVLVYCAACRREFSDSHVRNYEIYVFVPSIIAMKSYIYGPLLLLINIFGEI